MKITIVIKIIFYVTIFNIGERLEKLESTPGIQQE